jgi:hypothetical protein
MREHAQKSSLELPLKFERNRCAAIWPIIRYRCVAESCRQSAALAEDTIGNSISWHSEPCPVRIGRCSSWRL